MEVYQTETIDLMEAELITKIEALEERIYKLEHPEALPDQPAEIPEVMKSIKIEDGEIHLGHRKDKKGSIYLVTKTGAKIVTVVEEEFPMLRSMMDQVEHADKGE